MTLKSGWKKMKTIMNKKLIIIIALFLLLCLTACNDSSPEQEIAENETTAEQETEESYTVRFYKGSVAVFDSHDKLYDILEIPSNILTDADREELNKGIHAKNKSELQSIIEDYSS